ncbi:MAG: ribosomal-protein-alanine N-acetyltransferase [Paracoccaceae bacterium]
MTPIELALMHGKCFQTPRPWSEVEFSSFLADETCAFFELEQGFLIGRFVEDEGEVLTLAVDPSARGRGIGLALMQFFHKAAESHGIKQLFLEVSAENNAAITLYHKLGYQQTGSRPRYYQAPNGIQFDALVLALNLAATKT